MSIESYIIKAQKNFLNIQDNEVYPKYDKNCLDINRNLITKMNDTHKMEYGGASGGELNAKDNYPPKMSSLRSSSAMTFNLFGNDDATLTKKLYSISPNTYKVTFEKQIYTLGSSGQPANLDAFLDSDKEAVFCEMKMLEWLSNNHKPIKVQYYDEKNYFSKKGYDVFIEILNNLNQTTFKRYDAYQMFKHTLAIFNATFIGNPDYNVDKYNNEIKPLKLSRRYTKVTLANIVYQIRVNEIADERTWHSYQRLEKEELDDFEMFKSIMFKDNKLKKLFKDECNLDFDIFFISTYEFIQAMDKLDIKYLERYYKV